MRLETAIHRKGLFHNDIHDENVVAVGHRAVIVDFGLASIIRKPGSDDVDDMVEIIKCFCRRNKFVTRDLLADLELFFESSLFKSWRGGSPTTDEALS